MSGPADHAAPHQLAGELFRGESLHGEGEGWSATVDLVCARHPVHGQPGDGGGFVQEQPRDRVLVRADSLRKDLGKT